MSQSTADCTKIASGAQERTCLPCDIPPLCRNNYYRGKLLTERDFTDEQRYAMEKLRLHNQRLHGWGVVCGLIVKPHPYCPEKRLVVGDGFAIDDCGREIRLLAEDYALLPQPLPGSGGATAARRDPPADTGDSGHAADDTVARGDAGGVGHDDWNGNAAHGGDGAQGSEDDCGCDDPIPIDLYLCIRYAECETEFSPAPFDDCSCSTSSQKANRVCEGYVLELYQQKPEFWDHARHGDCDAGDCCGYFRDARECCQEPSGCPCLPLAVIRNFVPGSAVTAEQIDNWCSRRELSSTETLDRVVRCILTKLPTEELTRIEDTNWEHDRRMLCREFMEEFVGSAERPRGFRVDFSHKVHSGRIDGRSFQAMVVFAPENPSEPRHMQIVPALVEHEHDETSWARLCIDAGYARRHLEGKDFDLFITMKCDVIHDHHGRSVDGDFLGHLPTGNHIQGGTFESWVRVRMRSRNE